MNLQRCDSSCGRHQDTFSRDCRINPRLLIKDYGLEQMREPHVKHLEGSLWEMRMKGKDGISRAIYVTARGRRVVVVRAFIKKTQKTPRREINLALERAKELNP